MPGLGVTNVFQWLSHPVRLGRDDDRVARHGADGVALARPVLGQITRPKEWPTASLGSFGPMCCLSGPKPCLGTNKVHSRHTRNDSHKHDAWMTESVGTEGASVVTSEGESVGARDRAVARVCACMRGCGCTCGLTPSVMFMCGNCTHMPTLQRRTDVRAAVCWCNTSQVIIKHIHSPMGHSWVRDTP